MTAEPDIKKFQSLLYNAYHCGTCGEHLKPDWRTRILYHVVNDTENPCPYVGKSFELPVVELREARTP